MRDLSPRPQTAQLDETSIFFPSTFDKFEANMVVYLTFVVNYKLVYVPSLLILFLLEVDRQHQLAGLVVSLSYCQTFKCQVGETFSLPAARFFWKKQRWNEDQNIVAHLT